MVTPMPLSRLKEKTVVVMPDVYVDVLVPCPPWESTQQQLARIAQRGGGNLPVPPITFKLGGNAFNLSIALARLGANVKLIARTNALGYGLLQRAARDSPLSLDHVEVVSDMASTVSLECRDANLMLSHAGPVASFGPEALTNSARDALQDADAVAVVNWAQNARGNELLRDVCKQLAGCPAFLFVDTADPRHRAQARTELLSDPSLWHRVNAWGLNENELLAFMPEADDLISAALQLSSTLGVRLDLHTRRWAASITTTEMTKELAESTPGLRKTGAGDAWNAGNLAGQLLSFSARKRLQLAHRVATAYVTDTEGLPPRAAHLTDPLSGTAL